jgi:Putative auto-transporter adhesin, head GIN domain
MRTALCFAPAAVTMTAAACEAVAHPHRCRDSAPAGQRVTQSRAVRGFHQIDLQAPARLIVKQGARDSLTLQADRRLLPYLRTDVRKGRLEIEQTDEGHDRFDDECLHETIVQVTVANLSALLLSGAGSIGMASFRGRGLDVRLSGAGSIHVGRLSVGRLDLDLTGAGSLVAAGQATTQRVMISGAGGFHGERLASQRAHVTISGTGGAEINARDTLDVIISGVGGVRYVGNPRIRRTISGVGSLARLR